MLGISKQEEAPLTPQRPLSPLGDACTRKDLTAIHEILLNTHYRDDEGTGTNEVVYHFNLYIFLCSWYMGSGYFYVSFSVVIPRMDSTNERYVGGKETW